MPVPPKVAHPIRPFTPVSRIDEVEARIKEFITQNDMQPGQRLPGESWFADQLGVGRPLIREAMKGLQAVGAIEARRGVGRFVGSFDPDAYLSHYTTQMLLQSFTEQELVETRWLLEIAMATDAVGRLRDEDLDEIQRLWAEIQESAAAGVSNTGADLGLHRVIMGRAGNRLIVSMLDAVYALAMQRRGSATYSQEKIAEDAAQHAKIVEAAMARDGQAAQVALVTHFRTTATRLGFEQRWQDVFSRQPVTKGG